MSPDWHILGAGSIGCLFASALYRAGCATTLLVRNNTAASSDRPSTASVCIVPRGSLSQGSRPPENSSTIALPFSTPSDSGYISHLLLTTKAYDARPALASVAHRLDESSHVLLLVNGLGVLEELEADHSQLKFYCGTTTEGAYRKSPRQIVHAGTGTTRIGRDGERSPPPWFKIWATLSLSCVWEDDINASLWQKLAVNCAINPLTAQSRCNNGDLLSRPELCARLSPVCDEIASVSAAAGHGTIARNLHQKVRQVIANTAENRSSMLQDVLAGRRTEIEYISGYLVSAARRLKIPVPLNESLLEDIRKIDS